jgi:hypothetical protein
MIDHNQIMSPDDLPMVRAKHRVKTAALKAKLAGECPRSLSGCWGWIHRQWRSDFFSTLLGQAGPNIGITPLG